MTWDLIFVLVTCFQLLVKGLKIHISDRFGRLLDYSATRTGNYYCPEILQALTRLP